jgi:hypothetical protein
MGMTPEARRRRYPQGFGKRLRSNWAAAPSPYSPPCNDFTPKANGAFGCAWCGWAHALVRNGFPVVQA